MTRPLAHTWHGRLLAKRGFAIRRLTYGHATMGCVTNDHSLLSTLQMARLVVDSKVAHVTSESSLVEAACVAAAAGKQAGRSTSSEQ